MGWYPAVVTEAPVAEPLTLDDAKTWGQFDAAADDDRISAALTANRSWVEEYTGTYLAEQTVTAKCDCFADLERLPLAPVTLVVIKYLDTAGAEQTMPEDAYELRADGLQSGVIPAFGRTWPATRSGSRITVEAVCGYEVVPATVLQAIRLLTIADVDGTRDEILMGTVWALLENSRRYL